MMCGVRARAGLRHVRAHKVRTRGVQACHCMACSVRSRSRRGRALGRLAARLSITAACAMVW
eukprot:scaffold921_cov397-Prasinococcus_capsulatus_cf.AAC.13